MRVRNSIRQARPSRKSMRWDKHDYSLAGEYFVTVCLQDRRCLLGEVIGGKMILNPAGKMVEETWLRLPERYPNVSLDNYSVLPDHFHGIVVIEEKTTQSLESMMRWFKSRTTIKYTRGVRDFGWPRFEKRLWQRGYFDHVIRNNRSWERISEYISANAFFWRSDPEKRGIRFKELMRELKK